jgi:hypothetical protein
MHFEEEAETLGNLRMAQAASLLGYVNGISPLEHYRMRHGAGVHRTFMPGTATMVGSAAILG